MAVRDASSSGRVGRDEPGEAVAGADRVPLAFDVYGTLGDPSGMAGAFRGLSEDPEGLAARWRTHQLEISWLLTVMGRYKDFRAVTEYALATVFAEAGLDLSEAQRDDLLAQVDRLELYDDVEPALDRLEKAGFRLAVVSNGSPAMLEALLEGAGIRDRFEPVISVDEVGAFKPAPVVYEHAARRLGCDIAETWLVSGNPFDAAGAKAAGMRVAKVERGRSFSYPFAELPDLVVASLTALAAELAETSQA